MCQNCSHYEARTYWGIITLHYCTAAPEERLIGVELPLLAVEPDERCQYAGVA